MKNYDSMEKPGLQNHLEWESIEWPLNLVYEKSIHNFYTLPKECLLTIYRDEEFNLVGRITGETDDPSSLEYIIDGEKPRKGQIITGDELIAKLLPINEYIIKGFHLGESSYNYKKTSEGFTTIFNSKIYIDSIQGKHSSGKQESLIEFHLTSSIDFLFPRTTERNSKSISYKIRADIDSSVDIFEEKIDMNGQPLIGVSSSRDFFHIKTKDFEFIVQKVDDSILPDWANGIQIEYRNSFKKIPNKNTRKKVSEIVGFILGTKLYLVGETSFDKNQNFIKRNAYNPSSDNIISECSNKAMPPIYLKSNTDWLKIERVLNNIIDNYFSLRKLYGLGDVLWKHWIAKNSPIGVNLPIYSSALESLAEQYVRNNGLVKKYSKTAKKTYKKLIEEDVKSLADKIAEYSFSSRVISTIENPFHVGSGMKIALFLKDIGIVIDENSIETKALQARNKMAHSSIGTSNDEIHKYIRLTRAYQALMNRVLLLVLGHTEGYIDYYTYGHPEISIYENISI